MRRRGPAAAGSYAALLAAALESYESELQYYRDLSSSPLTEAQEAGLRQRLGPPPADGDPIVVYGWRLGARVPVALHGERFRVLPDDSFVAVGASSL